MRKYKYTGLVFLLYFLISCGPDNGAASNGRAIFSNENTVGRESCRSIYDSLYSICTTYDSAGVVEAINVTNSGGARIYEVAFDTDGRILNDSGMPADYTTLEKNVDLCMGDSVEFVFIPFPIFDIDSLVRKVDYFTDGEGFVELANDTIAFLDSFRFTCRFGNGAIDRLHVSIKGLSTDSKNVYGSASYIDQFHLTDCSPKP